jgi:hypothetical protein
MKQTGICLNCNTHFVYYDNQSGGKFCSNSCQGENKVKGQLRKGTRMTVAMRKYLNRYLGDYCECGQGRLWNNKKLTLQIDHKDGDISNNEIENLRLICPNCHTQTDNWGIKNISENGRIKLKKQHYARDI